MFGIHFTVYVIMRRPLLLIFIDLILSLPATRHDEHCNNNQTRDTDVHVHAHTRDTQRDSVFPLYSRPSNKNTQIRTAIAYTRENCCIAHKQDTQTLRLTINLRVRASYHRD